MPDMDGFKLLEIVGLEMDLPVIMMSANSDYSTVLKGIKHGARDYLLKPIRIEQLKNIWQHVIRKTLLEPKEGNDITDKDKCGTKGVGDGASKATRKCRDQSEEKEHEADDPSVEDPASQKKQRINWSGELHSQFISAVEHLGVENAVPKRILDLMSTPWLTRENVASHLQKYRKGLRRKSAGMNHNGTTSDRIDCDPPTALQSFDNQHPDAVNCLDGFKMDGSSNNSDIIQLGHVRNPGTFSISPVKTQSLPFLLPNSQDVLFQQYRSPKADQLYQIMQTPGLGDVSTDGLNLLSISPRPDQLETFTGVSSHIPSYYASDKSGATPNCSPEYVSKGHPLGIFFDAAESSCSKVSDSVATDLGAISPLGTVLNSLPGQCKGQNVGDFHRSLVHLDLGTSLELQSCKVDRFMGSGQLKPAEDPDPPMDLWMDNIFDLSGSRSPEDLGAVVKQFHQQHNL